MKKKSKYEARELTQQQYCFNDVNFTPILEGRMVIPCIQLHTLYREPKYVRCTKAKRTTYKDLGGAKAQTELYRHPKVDLANVS